MKKILLLCLCLVMLVGLLSGCLEQETPYVPTGDGLHIDSVTQPVTRPSTSVEQIMSLCYYPDRSLNPYEASDPTNRVLLPLLYQSLFQVDAQYTPVPILCSGYAVSRDGKTYTFSLEAATFSDGTVLTAADVVASLEAARESKLYSGRLHYVSEISVTQENKVEIRLSTAYENLPLLLDIPIVKAGQTGEANPLGTGAYYLEDARTGLRLVRRTDWWCSSNLAVTATYIPLVEVNSPSEMRDQFEFGNISLVCTDPGSDQYVDYHNDYELWDCENHILLYLGCNENSPVFSDRTLRQALTHAIDRAHLAETVYRGFAQATALPASPDFPYYHKSLAAKYSYDAEKFSQAVADAALTDVTVTVLVNKSDSYRVQVARKIAQMLTDCGLPAVTSELGTTEYTKALKKGNYDLYLGQTRLSPNMDLSAFYTADGALSYGGMSDAAILAICKEALANSGNYYTMYQMVMEDAMLCPILVRSYAVYMQRGVLAELTPARDNLFCYSLGKTLEDVYIQE